MKYSISENLLLNRDPSIIVKNKTVVRNMKIVNLNLLESDTV